MIKEFRIPTPGESITEVEISSWMVEDGSWVEKNTEVAEVESDKATLVLVAEVSGIISIKAPAGKTVAVGSLAFTIETGAAKPASAPATESEKPKEVAPKAEILPKQEKPAEDPYSKVKLTPVASEMMKENGLNIEEIINGLRRLTKEDIQKVVSAKNKVAEEPSFIDVQGNREVKREKMTMLRRRLSERLVSVKNETAMLTTFNEIDMGTIIELRQNMQAKFTEKHGFKLGFMGFFTKAVSIAAQWFPAVNAQIEGEDIVTPSFVDVGIAVQTPKGLMVPIVRNAESKTVAQIETNIKELAQRARDKKITIEELSGGTISITNGGVFGSLFSTPIINPPQSAILGMHNIVDRPVAVSGQVVVRPMMYVALSYDHRIIDGKNSVGFLVKVKEMIEHPERMLINGDNPAQKFLE